MTIKEAYMKAKEDDVKSFIIIVETLLSYGKVSLHDDISTLTPFLEVNGEKWNSLIRKTAQQRGMMF